MPTHKKVEMLIKILVIAFYWWCVQGRIIMLSRVLPTLVGSGQARPPLSTERPPLSFLRPVHTVHM